MATTAGETVTIPGHCNGPVGYGNGGYSCGAFAALLDGPAAVELRNPVPLDTPLEVVGQEEDEVRVVDGETLIATVRRIEELDTPVPEALGLERAREAAGGYRALKEGLFSGCFVCGLARDDDHSLGVFAGEITGAEAVSTPWRPPPWTADEEGRLKEEFVWAALDCPTYFAAFYGVDPYPISFLASFAAEIIGPIEVGAEYEVSAWRLEVDGRKRRAVSAIFSPSGELLARAQALWIEPRPA